MLALQPTIYVAQQQKNNGFKGDHIFLVAMNIPVYGQNRAPFCATSFQSSWLSHRFFFSSNYFCNLSAIIDSISLHVVKASKYRIFHSLSAWISLTPPATQHTRNIHVTVAIHTTCLAAESVSSSRVSRWQLLLINWPVPRYSERHCCWASHIITQDTKTAALVSSWQHITHFITYPCHRAQDKTTKMSIQLKTIQEVSLVVSQISIIVTVDCMWSVKLCLHVHVMHSAWCVIRDAWSVWENRAWVICVWCLHVCVSVVRDMCVACPWNQLHAAIAPCSDSLHEIPVHAHIRSHTHEPGGESPPCTHPLWVPCAHHLHYMQQHNSWTIAQGV